MEFNPISSSFRDPSGYVFADGDLIKRKINPVYFKQFNSLSESGFYDKLFQKKYLVPHKLLSQTSTEIVVQATKIPFVSYPYEWSFLQYKHAGLLTLKIQKYCLENSFTLKDASAFNVTFHEGNPIFIDTLSFEIYKENAPWFAYKQFIMHFLGPLVLCKYFGLDQLKLLSYSIDGITLEKLSKLLPAKSYLSPTIFTNIHLLAKFEKKYASNNTKKENKLSKKAQIKLLEGIYDFIKNLTITENTQWDNYYDIVNYDEKSIDLKKQLTKKWFSEIKAKSLIDIGGNDGTFSRELKDKAEILLVVDIDANAVEQNYKQVLKNKEKNILPLVIDIFSPPSGYGFNNSERFSFIERVKSLRLDGCLALAVIHHISLTGNITFSMSAEFFAKIANSLLIEFPTREDTWVQFLLDSKREFKSNFDFYNEENFEIAYATYFEIISKVTIPNTHRILYSLKRIN
jgi:hypothetical protein